MNRIHLDDYCTYQSMIERIHKGLENNLHCEYRVSDNENNWHWILTQAVVIKRNDDNTVNKIVGIDRIIDSQKNVENLLYDELIETKLQLQLLELIGKIGQSSDSYEKSLHKLRNIVGFDLCEVFTFKNGSYCGFIHYPEEQIYISDVSSIFDKIQDHLYPVIIDNELNYSPYHSILVIPIGIYNNRIGCVILFHNESGYYKGKDLFPVRSFSDLFAIVLSNHQQKVQKKSLERRIHKKEHLHIARELHDGIAQNLAYSKIITEQLINLSSLDSMGKSELEKLHNVLLTTLKEVRILSEDLRITSESQHLESLLEKYCKQLDRYFDIQIIFKSNNCHNIMITPDISENLLRIIQEGISNSSRHSNGNKVVISLSHIDYQIIIHIEDNGIGIQSSIEGLGLKGIRERVSLIDGDVFWNNKKKESGTVLEIRLSEDVLCGDNNENIID